MMEDTTNNNMAVHAKGVKSRTELEEAWTEILVAGVSDAELSQMWREAVSSGYPRSIVLRVWYAEDRLQSALVAYC